MIETVLQGYADRPALGQRAVEFVKDPNTGRTSAHLLPRFDTITYRELADRVGALASAWAARPSRPVTASPSWASPASTTPRST
ncbi:putative FATTY-ACID-CoA LIGASE FADD9 domain protein [Mycobacterium xenopi 3993]|nr:putative FATTY-ACID-CoA LIGASE FADD9 domain protein [Mycobacterium xenopi 3993]